MRSYDEILQNMLSSVPNNLDKRVGGVLYTAIASYAKELYLISNETKELVEQTYIETATGENLDRRGADYAIKRKPATYAEKIAKTYGKLNGAEYPLNIPIGSRFMVPDNQDNIIYTLKKYISEGEEPAVGTCVLVCERAGAIGNLYSGNLLPLSIIPGLTRIEIVGTYISAENEEADEEYRERILDKFRKSPFGGNIDDYREAIKSIAGVGKVKIFPAWEGGKTVLLSIVDNDFKPISSSLIQDIKDFVDPEESEGLGLGWAPINHNVTVVTPDIHTINISAKVKLDNVTTGVVLPEIRKNIENYLNTINEEWERLDELNIYIAKISEAITSAQKVINVTDINIDGDIYDVAVKNDKYNQHILTLGSVTLYELLN